MKSLAPEPQCAEGVFQIQFPICDVFFANNVPIPKSGLTRRKQNFNRPLKPLNH